MEKQTSVWALLCLVWSAVAALQVDIPKEEYEFVRGDNITLPCTFKSAQSNPRIVIISWSAEGPDTPADETLILTHYHPGGVTDITSIYEGRVSLDVNVASGKADLKLSSITMADNKEFECHVQIPRDDEGQPADTARLTVLVPPSPPICRTQGKAEYGQNINLTCNFMEGFPAPSYRWERWDMLNTPVQEQRTDTGGTLSLYNISKNTSGIYICTSSNKARSVQCSITLHVMPPPLSINSITRIITRVVAFLIISLIVIYCSCFKKQ